MYFVKFLVAVEFLGFYVIQSASERLATFLVEDPSIRLVYLVRVQSHQIFHSREVRKFRFWNASKGEKHCSKPNFLNMGLVGILGDNLLDSKLSSTFGVLSEPNQAETPSSQKFDLLKAIREAISKYFLLFFGQSKTLV